MNDKKYIIDSRNLTDPENTVFIALVTNSGNGHQYIGQLFEKGVREFIVSEKVDNEDEMSAKGAVFHYVRNTLEELQRLATEKRKRTQAKVVAITGSRGKTVLKELLKTLIGKNCQRSPRSFNSQIGVPLSIMTFQEDDSPLLIEAGISRLGEMKQLEKIIKPDIVVLTNITDEHENGFENRRQKIREKLELAKNTNILVTSIDDGKVWTEVKNFIEETGRDIRTITWSLHNPSANIYLKTADRVSIDGKDYKISTQIKDPRDVNILLGAIAARYSMIGQKVGSELERLETSFVPMTRLTVLEALNNCKIIIDRFFLDSVSIEPALCFMRRVARPGTELQVIAMLSPEIDFSSLYGKIKEFGITNIKFVQEGELNDFIDSVKTDDFKNKTILLNFGNNTIALNRLTGKLEAQQHETILEVNLDSIVHNFNWFKSKLKPSTGIIAMLKAAGYGHGSVELAQVLETQGVGYLAVAVIDEGIELRHHGIKSPIIVLNPRSHNIEQMIRLRLEPVIYNFDILDKISKVVDEIGVKDFPLHIKLDTGMRRVGFVENELPSLIRRLKELKNHFRIATVFSHLATADCPDMDDYTLGQIEKFDKFCDIIQKEVGYGFRRHILNSAGIIRFPSAQYQLVRLGIGLYGIPTLPSSMEEGLEQGASLYTTVISIKKWKEGDTVGYSRKGKLLRDSVIATLPVGYADGIDRRLGNGHAEFIVNGHRCPTVGNICMDICMIDVSDVSDCHVGDKVEIFGKEVTLSELAQKLETIPYEIITSISGRVKRVYFRE